MVTPASLVAPAGGSARSVTAVIRSPSTSISTRSATPRPGPSQASSACQALTAAGPAEASVAREVLDHAGQGPNPGEAVLEGGGLGRAVAGAGGVADEQHGGRDGGGEGAGVVAGGLLDGGLEGGHQPVEGLVLLGAGVQPGRDLAWDRVGGVGVDLDPADGGDRVQLGGGRPG